MKLKVVKKGSHFHWPEGLGPTKDRYRGGEGTVIDLDAPFESEWCKGQEYKLEDAPAGAVPSKIEHPVALGMLGARKQAEEKRTADAAKTDATSGDAQKPKAPVGGGMPEVDDPRRPAKAKAG